MTHDLFSYPHAAGAKEETTSREAAEAIENLGRAATLRQRIFSLFERGRWMTADEAADELGEEPFSCRPRLTELYRLGVIERTGQRRRASGGRMSHVYRLVRT